MTNKPNLYDTDVWARTADPEEIQKPLQDVINRGFLYGEKPPHEGHNYYWKVFSEFLVHLNQNGVGEWDNATEYNQGALTKEGTLIYFALQSSTDKQPSTNPAFWDIAYREKARDADKLDGMEPNELPVSDATQTALDAKYDKTGGAISGDVSITGGITTTSGADIGGNFSVDGTSVFNNTVEILKSAEALTLGSSNNSFIKGVGTSGADVWYIGRKADGNNDLVIGQNNGGQLIRFNDGGKISLEGASGFTYNTNTVWHSGNDGDSSGLDADLLDGKQSTDFSLSSHNHDTRYLRKDETSTTIGDIRIEKDSPKLLLSNTGDSDANGVVDWISNTGFLGLRQKPDATFDAMLWSFHNPNDGVYEGEFRLSNIGSGTREIFHEGNAIDTTAGGADAGKGIKLNSNGKIDYSMLDSGAYPVAQFTPTAGTEYPDTTGERFGAYWTVTGLNAGGYTFTAGDLSGQIIYNNQLMQFGSGSWVILDIGLASEDFYRLDGSNAIIAPFQGGSKKYLNMAEGTDATDGANVGQTVQKSGDIMSGHLQIGNGTQNANLFFNRNGTGLYNGGNVVWESQDGSPLAYIYTTDSTPDSKQIWIGAYDAEGASFSGLVMTRDDVKWNTHEVFHEGNLNPVRKGQDIVIDKTSPRLYLQDTEHGGNAFIGGQFMDNSDGWHVGRLTDNSNSVTMRGFGNKELTIGSDGLLDYNGDFKIVGDMKSQGQIRFGYTDEDNSPALYKDGSDGATIRIRNEAGDDYQYLSFLKDGNLTSGGAKFVRTDGADFSGTIVSTSIIPLFIKSDGNAHIDFAKADETPKCKIYGMEDNSMKIRIHKVADHLSYKDFNFKEDGTMSIPSAPTEGLHGVNKNYADTKLSKAGGTLTSALIIEESDSAKNSKIELIHNKTDDSYAQINIKKDDIKEASLSSYSGTINTLEMQVGSPSGLCAIGIDSNQYPYIINAQGQHEIFHEGNAIIHSSGSVDAGRAIKLNSLGQIDASMLDVSTFHYVTSFTPVAGTEYPDISAETPGAFWDVENVDETNGYTFAGGDLVGLTIKNGEFMVWGTGGWSIMVSEMSPTLYYKLDGSNALTGDFNGGDFKIKHITDGTDATDGATVGQLDNHKNNKNNPHGITANQVNAPGGSWTWDGTTLAITIP